MIRRLAVFGGLGLVFSATSAPIGVLWYEFGPSYRTEVFAYRPSPELEVHVRREWSLGATRFMTTQPIPIGHAAQIRALRRETEIEAADDPRPRWLREIAMRRRTYAWGLEAGAPWPTFYTRGHDVRGLSGHVDEGLAELQIWGRAVRFPYLPIWSGLLANGLVYAVLLYALSRLPAPVRRLVRTCRGHCVGCGYDLGDASRCPECGRPKRR
ncbi:MAG: hypothetical protein AAFX79_11915 [Planctomycetota bacterium]